MNWAIPGSFQDAVLHPDRLAEDGGALDKVFVRLVYDLFVGDYLSLSYHPGGGKDGAIDLWADANNCRTVFECKQIGHAIKQQSWEAARNRWRSVRKHLEDNLPRGVEKCHAPYRVWFSKRPAIAKYFFVVSCPIFPVSHKDSLEAEIRVTFESLSRTASDLGHLKDICVSVCDWNDLRGRLEARPTYLFKWFRDFSIPGLRHVSSDRQIGGFRNYQHDSVLPYYSIRRHLDSCPYELIRDEETLWKGLVTSSAGLVIAGTGGIGKSRLMAELGKLAARDGWLVLDALPNVTATGVESVARRHEASGVLFLFDYLESLPEFRKISLSLVQFAGNGLRIRFIASARESFVLSNEMFDESVQVIDYSPVGLPESEWWRKYRRTTCSHIASHLGLKGLQDLPTDIPAIAVLEFELERVAAGAIGVGAVDRWVRQRLDALRKDGISRKDLALIAAQCPLSTEVVEHLPEHLRKPFAILCNGGWIEIREGDEGYRQYWMIHDYLADRIVVDWLSVEVPRGLSPAAEIRELLRVAYALGTLGSLIATLQRTLNEISGFGLEAFSKLIESEIASNDIWKLHRRDILYTKLLSPVEKITLLYRLAAYWVDATNESWFQLEIAVLAKAVTAQPGLISGIEPSAWLAFEKLVLSLAADADERNMLVTYGLRLMPDNSELQRISKSWLMQFGERFGATYVLRAWMEVGLPWRDVELAVRLWLQRFGQSVDAQFVLAAWLRSAKDNGIGTFAAEIRAWCNRYREVVEAQHVFSSWLRAGGAPATIRQDVQRWLSVNGHLEQEGSHLIRRWLRAGGDTNTIRPYLLAWVSLNASSESATFVFTAAAERVELQDLIREPMLEWIKAHPIFPGSWACISQWLVRGLPRALVAGAAREWLAANKETIDAGEVIGAWFRAGGTIDMVWQYVPSWLKRYSATRQAVFLLSELVKRESIPGEAKVIVPNWIMDNAATPDAEKVMSAWLSGKHGVDAIRNGVSCWCKTYATKPEARYLMEKWATAGGDAETIQGTAILWLSEHGTKLEAGRVLSALVKAGLSPREYGEHLRGWAALHKCAPDASYFYCEWLRKPNLLPTAISKSVTAWLEDNSNWVDADFVLNAWLKHEKADPDTIRTGYEKWMAHYSGDLRARIVQKHWEQAVERQRRRRLEA